MSDNQPNNIKVNEDGKPFANEQAARDYIKAKELDRANFIPRKYQGGFAIYDMEATISLAAGQMAGGSKEKEADEKYWLVEFNQAGSTNDCPHVPLIVNNWDLRITRGKQVVIPHRFLEAAQHAEQTNYVPDDSAVGVGRQPMKAQGKIMRFPPRILREATRKEFEDGLASGNGIQNEWLSSLRRAAP